MAIETSSASALLERLVNAVNHHDLDAMTDCFATNFVNETPIHPARSFVGREQVRKNWDQIFGAIPDVHADIVRQSVDDGTAWMEWELSGTRIDGKPSLMRGVAILGAEAGRFVWVRFYLEPVEQGGLGIDAAVREHTGR